ncbi:hypothetical protein AVEN_272351-1 [Araneus ventricosus]|uniref:Uncharacterized protein n=1 Tax=Araneus ventricosus TaxID=182803 RepID=A0A4Y2GQU8_ARAVE|nr:hypothetical protein AVEN_272351-1 [Araneus ventricosus]
MFPFFSPHGKWKSRRRLFNPCFHPDMLRCYLNKFNYTSQELVKVLQDEARKDFVEILDPLTLCAFASMCGLHVSAVSLLRTMGNLSIRSENVSPGVLPVTDFPCSVFGSFRAPQVWHSVHHFSTSPRSRSHHL